MPRPRSELLPALILLLVMVLLQACASRTLYLNGVDRDEESDVAYLYVEKARDLGVRVRQVDTCDVGRANVIVVAPGRHTITFCCRVNLKQLFSSVPVAHISSGGTVYFGTDRWRDWGQGGEPEYAEIESAEKKTIDWIAAAGNSYEFVGEVRVLPQRFLESLKWEWSGHVEAMSETERDDQLVDEENDEH